MGVLISLVHLNSILAVRLSSNEDLPLLALLDTQTVFVWVCLVPTLLSEWFNLSYSCFSKQCTVYNFYVCFNLNIFSLQQMVLADQVVTLLVND